jgi:multiple sugar transport system permease protein
MIWSRRKTYWFALNGATYAFLLLASLFFVLPIAWIFSTSFKPQSDIFAIPATLIPSRWTGENYLAVFQGGVFGRYLLNSLVAAAGGTALGLLLGVPAARRYPEAGNADPV